MSDAPVSFGPPPNTPAPRAELIHIDVDRRLGHDWDEWDGKPLPDQGNFDAPPSLFFGWAAASLLVAFAIVAALLFLLSPRLRELHASLPTIAWGAVIVLGGGALIWLVLLGASYLV